MGLWWHWEAWYVEHTLRWDQDQVSTAFLSPDETRIILWRRGGQWGDVAAALFDASNGRMIAHLRPPPVFLYEPKLTPDGKRMLAYCEQMAPKPAYGGRRPPSQFSIRLWDLATGRSVLALDGLGPVLTPDGTAIVCTDDENKAAIVYDAATGARLRAIDLGKKRAGQLLVCPDGRRLISSESRTVWDLTTGEQMGTIDLPAGARYTLRFSPDGSRLLACRWDQSQYVESVLIDTDSLQRVGEAIPCATIYPTFSPSGDRLVATPKGDEVCVWDTRTGSKDFSFHAQDGEGLVRPHFICNGERIAAWALDEDGGNMPMSPVRVFSAHDGTMLWKSWGSFWAVTRDGRRIVADLAEVWILDGLTGDRIHIFQDIPFSSGHCVAMAPDGDRLLMMGRFGEDGGTTGFLYRRRRPEWWWGVFYLSEFWLTAVFAGVFVWSVWRDRRRLADRGGAG